MMLKKNFCPRFYSHSFLCGYQPQVHVKVRPKRIAALSTTNSVTCFGSIVQGRNRSLSIRGLSIQFLNQLPFATPSISVVSSKLTLRRNRGNETLCHIIRGRGLLVLTIHHLLLLVFLLFRLLFSL